MTLKFRGQTISEQQARVIRYIKAKYYKQAARTELLPLVKTPAILDVMVQRGLLRIKSINCYYIPPER